jgi:hypothetical protein
MSFRNCVYNSRTQSIRLFTWDVEGKRVSYDLSVSPYLYIEDNAGDKKTIYGTRAKKKTFTNSYNRNKFISDSGITRVYENLPVVQQYLIDTFWRDNESEAFTSKPLKVTFLDIET